MDDREIAKIIRKRNLAYVKHLNEIQPHLEKHDRLEGGVWSAVAAAARIAARALAKAGRATARAAAKGAKAAARAAAKGAKATARAAAKAAKATARAAKNAARGIVNNIDTIATAADIAQRGYNISQILKGKQRRGEPITEEDWEDLDDNQY
jgi:membrane protein involved in colicin uptake